MAKSKSSSRVRFGRAARKANATCHRESNSVSSFKSCMRREMKANLKREGFKVKR